MLNSLVAQNHVGQLFRFDIKFFVVVNQSLRPEFVHEMRNARTGCAYHLGKDFMTHQRDCGIRHDIEILSDESDLCPDCVPQLGELLTQPWFSKMLGVIATAHEALAT